MTIKQRANNSCANSAMNIHLLDVFVALMFDIRLGNCQIPEASSTPFLYIDSLPQSHPKARLRQENSCKVSKKENNLQTFPQISTSRPKTFSFPL